MVGHTRCSARVTAAPLTITSAEAIADGPGWRLRFREIASRDAADTLRGAYLEAEVRPDEDLARGVLLLARGHRLHRSRCRRRRNSARSRTSTGSARPRSSPSTAVHTRASTCRPCGPSSGSSRRGVARSWSMAIRSTCDSGEPRGPIRTDPRRHAGARAASPRRQRRRPGLADRARDRSRRTTRPNLRYVRRRPSRDPRDRGPDPLSGDVRRAACPEHPGTDPGAGARLDHRSTTCASGGSAGIAPSTTRRTAGERG